MFCFVARLMISNALDNQREPPARVLSHIERCDACRSYREESGVLQDHLERGARPATEYSPFLHARIMNSVKSDHHGSNVRKSVWPFAVGVASALIIVGISVAWLADSKSKPHRNAAVAVSAEWGSLQRMEAGLAQAETLLNQGPDLFTRPLSDEMQLLESDIGKVAVKLGSILDRDIFNMIADHS